MMNTAGIPTCCIHQSMRFEEEPFLSMMRNSRSRIPSRCRLSVLLGLAATGGGISSRCAAAAAGTSCARSTGYGGGRPIRSSSIYASHRPSSSLHKRASPVALCCFGSPAVATPITACRQSGHMHVNLWDMRCSSHRPSNSAVALLRNNNRRPSGANRRCLTTSASSRGNNEVNGTNENKGAAGKENDVATSSIRIRDHQRRLLDEIIASFTKERYRNVVVVNGAGVSTSCGIPDFRTPGTGLYSQLEQYDLPHPEAIFDLDYFQNDPRPFAMLASEIWPGQKDGPRPSRAHAFLKVLQDRGVLRRVYTQNIDGLESLAGVSDDKLVECHGHFRSCACTSSSCRRSDAGTWTAAEFASCRDSYLSKKTPHRCPDCGSLAKPTVVFFGEELPRRFQDLIHADMGECDLLLVMGTSLLVNPVASIPEWVGRDVPRLLLNRELVGAFAREEMMDRRWGDEEEYKSSGSGGRDVFLEGDCDQGVEAICKLVGEDWSKDLTKAARH